MDAELDPDPLVIRNLFLSMGPNGVRTLHKPKKYGVIVVVISLICSKYSDRLRPRDRSSFASPAVGRHPRWAEVSSKTRYFTPARCTSSGDQINAPRPDRVSPRSNPPIRKSFGNFFLSRQVWPPLSILLRLRCFYRRLLVVRILIILVRVNIFVVYCFGVF